MSARTVSVGSGPNENIEGQIEKTWQAQCVTIKPWDHGDNNNRRGGFFRQAFFSGSIAGATTPPAVLGAFRWGDPSFYMKLMRVQLRVLCTAFSTGVSLDFDLIKSNNCANNSYSGGTGLTGTGPSRARTSLMKQSLLLNSGDARIATTAALTAPGTAWTLDTAPFAGGFAQITAAQNASDVELYRATEMGTYPMTFEQNEGFLLRNANIALPASNTIKLILQLDWLETANVG